MVPYPGTKTLKVEAVYSMVYETMEDVAADTRASRELPGQVSLIYKAPKRSSYCQNSGSAPKARPRRNVPQPDDKVHALMRAL